MHFLGKGILIHLYIIFVVCIFFVYQYNYLILIQNTFSFANKFIKAINMYLSGDYIV